MLKPTVACVLRSGGDYGPEHVMALRAGVARHLSVRHSFVCLTDMAVGCETVRLPRDWPGWWAKIGLFAPGLLRPPVLYLDLDTVVVGPLGEMASGHRFTMCDDFFRPGDMNSSVMAWSADLSPVYEAFAADPVDAMARYRVRGMWGDQDFIAHHAPVHIATWSAGQVVSFKRDVAATGEVPAGASVLAFHGKPRPWQTPFWQPAGGC